MGPEAADRGQSGKHAGRPQVSQWVPGQTLLADYVIERELGEGGMGKVYLVKSKSTGQRFAVKTILTSKLGDETSRRNFLAELQTWIDLPEHPHLTACRFFRTVGDQVAIFAEYVEGGTLAGWIEDRKLTRLEQILDVTIQFAWGLHAAHELGLVHQDVKPGNVLMTAGGVAKVTDFGLARARAAVAETGGTAEQSVAVNARLMTREYCSPEQAAGKPLSRKTDIWSWGLSVLQMFTGDVTWRNGQAAPDVLDGYLETVSNDPQLPAMPTELAEVLRKCFRQDPSARWSTMAQAADALRSCYRQAVDGDYPREAPIHVARGAEAALVHDRWTRFGEEWTNPRKWLIEAFLAADRDPAGVEDLLQSRTGSRKAQAIADLAAYEEAYRIFERLVAAGRKELESILVPICQNKALVHINAGDIPGALALYDQCIAICHRLANQETRLEVAKLLAMVYDSKALAVRLSGDSPGALPLCDQAIAIWNRLVNQEGCEELANELAISYFVKANTVTQLNDPSRAVPLFDCAIAIWDRLVNREGRRELANRLAGAYDNKARALAALGDCDNAAILFDQGIAIWARLVTEEGRSELAYDLGISYTNKGALLRKFGHLPAAVNLHDQAITIFDRLVNQQGRGELAPALADAYLHKGMGLYEFGDARAAITSYHQAIAVLERMVKKEGHSELANNLATAYGAMAQAVWKLGDSTAAVVLYDCAITIRDRLVHQERGQQLASALAMDLLSKALVVANDDPRTALALGNKAFTIWNRQVNEEGQQEMLGHWARVRAFRAAVLLNLGDLKGAEIEAREAMPILQSQIERTGGPGLQDSLEWATAVLQKVETSLGR
jgi:tetratricopeptide (TPR) repeat protein